MLNRTQHPNIIDAVDLNLTLKPYESFSLANGVPVYAVNAGAEEVLMIELVFYAGNSYEHQNLVASATNHLLKNGTSKKTAFQISEHFDYYGAYLSRSCHNEFASVTLHCLSKHLNMLLPVIREIITDSVFTEEELEIYKQTSKQKLSVNLTKCDFVANRLIDVSLYGTDHPYGKFTSVADYDLLQTDRIKQFYRQYYQNGKCIIFTAGKLPANFKEQLNSSFGDLNINQSINSPAHIAIRALQKKARVSNDVNGVQGAIRLGRPFPSRHHPDFKKVTILNILFGGFFGSRLMSNIREEKGYTYGISSYLQNHIQESAWIVSTEAGKDVCEATLQEVYKEMKLLRENLVDDEELLLVKNYMMGTNLGDIDGPFQIIARWKTLILNNLDESYFYNSMNTIKNITAGEIRDLADKYLRSEDFFELVVI
ncbi:MAG: pitrilysin family protein [Ginsengibacter sp.]